VLAPQELGTY